ncbi:PREDICTED: E3 ubiquitin-protein ligase Os04g0590900-like [Ipomoea nil]|uniref:E3 ubiquitin-protein ligase Os04g0590900-like n=1 Tax=Ipomoea nil TaxID=35883 RepID=UPI000900A318|nr:PREDICTED: E3 ubiquitin-protein ligase Os04g0590900-like [Ipomoea nil]
MVAMNDPKTWVPYWNTRDCSQGFCSLYCPQWCNYKITPPPPPSSSAHRPYFSPLIIAIAGILAAGFLLISYYAVMSKYCRNRPPSPDPGSSHEDQPCNAAAGENGLCEARINSIAVFKYRKGDGAVDGSDCPVCLGEFQEDDRLRLLPTCRHAFHVACIDPWLKSNSNCPLCRASIVFSTGNQERRSDEPEIPVRDNRHEHSVIPIADNHGGENQEIIRRSLSMNYVYHQGRLSVADILRMDDDDHFPDSQLRHTLSLSRAKFLFPMLNRGRLATIPF